jgi:hypothetical protein
MLARRLFGFATVLLFACSGDTPNDVFTDVIGDQITPDSIQGDGGADTTGDSDVDRIVSGRYQIIVHHDIASPLPTLIEQSARFSATVVDYVGGGPAAELPVSFEIVKMTDLDGNPRDDGDAVLDAENIVTDDLGRVENRLYAASVGDIIYTIEISVPDTDTTPVRFPVRVTEVECGCVEVQFEYDGVQEKTSLHDISVAVLPSNLRCGAHLGPTTVINDSLVLAERMASNISGTIKFDCIPAGSNYTIYAKAKGAIDACVAAYSCDRTLVLVPNTCDQVVLNFYDAELKPSGSYKSVDHFDFSKLVEACAGGDTTIVDCATSAGDVGKTICCALNELNKFFKTPGLSIIETFQSLIVYYFGQLAGDIIDLFKDTVANLLTEYLKNNSPEWLQDFFTIGESMMDIINNLELHSDLDLRKPQQYTVQGTHYYQDLVLYWKIGCDPDAPDFADCGKWVLSMEDLQNADIPTDIVGGEFTATIHNFNQFLVHQHELGLHYGRLVLYVLNEIVIKTVTGGKANSLQGVARLWIDCAKIVDGIDRAIGNYLGSNYKATLEQYCNNAVDSIFNFVNGYLEGLTLGSTLMIRGGATLVDDNCDPDLLVDRIVNGTWEGQLQGNAQQATVTGTWEATRK